MKTGTKYSRDLDVAEIAKLIRSDIKEAVKTGTLPKVKYTVRIQRFANGRAIDVHVWDGAEKNVAIVRGLREITDAYNYDHSDPASDYFNVNFHCSVVFEPGRGGR